MKKFLFLAAILFSWAATAQTILGAPTSGNQPSFRRIEINPPGSIYNSDGVISVERTLHISFDDGFNIECVYEPTVFGMTNAMMKTWYTSNPWQPTFVRVRIDNSLPGVTRFFDTTKLIAVYDNVIGMLSVMKGGEECDIHYATK